LAVHSAKRGEGGDKRVNKAENDDPSMVEPIELSAA